MSDAIRRLRQYEAAQPSEPLSDEIAARERERQLREGFIMKVPTPKPYQTMPYRQSEQTPGPVTQTMPFRNDQPPSPGPYLQQMPYRKPRLTAESLREQLLQTPKYQID